MRALRDVAAALHEAGVDFVVVGGAAVVLHGHLRATVDIDLALDLATDNVSRAVAALAAAGFRPRLPVPAESFADPAIRDEWVRDRNLIAFAMHDPDDPLREVDLLAITTLPYEGLRDRAVRIDLDGVSLPVVGLDDLIEMKRQAGRTQDCADIEALLRLPRHPNPSPSDTEP